MQTKTSGKIPIGPIILISAGAILIIAMIVWQLASTTTTPASPTAISSSNLSEETQIAAVPRVSLADAKTAFDQAAAAVFVDVRDSDSYAAGHVSGSINVPFSDLVTRIGELDPNRWIITYCT